jgi:hypothetical protein
LESKKELKGLLDRGKVTQEQYDEILDSLPEKLEKYAGWIGRNINDTEASINHIIDLLNWFENNKNKLDEKDINKYTVDSLQSIFDKIGVSKSQKQKEIKSDGAKLIYEDDEYLLYEIYNHEASCYYGSGAAWCIRGDQSWDRYINQFAGFMFLIKKNGDRDDEYYKVAIAYKDYEGKRYVLAAFDASNQQINKTKLKSITKSLNNNWDYEYYLDNERWYGNVPMEIISNEDILNKLVKGTYIIQSDGTVDVNGNVNMLDVFFTKIPVKFGKITGDFYCFNNKLTTLEGSPQSVGGNFICYKNQLTNLEGAPQSVEGNFDCSDNQLTSLKGAPQSVGGNFILYNNQLTSLEGAPKSVGGNFDCSSNKLTTLEGSPQSVGGGFYCSNNQLTSLEGSPQSVGGDFGCYNNRLDSLEGAPKSVGGSFDCSNNQLTSLVGAPQSVGGSFDCSYNQLTSLLGSLKSVGDYFDCSNNKVKFTEDDVIAVCEVKNKIII